ncbi:gamma-glutamyl-gamma-aminobutyrate hydrolase family protein [Caloramator sp. CAR-1]|uniref:gamma-glutamyl-gamma-aminobutyrate hydrolase family protein n=1 Tax=Caloramator sp. CAR-1 TaxID=3062777 RepID=UPI0026E3151B|nr:gamma-glutamyl-gamma-aminobutyrate hydrolase family protein [Caloramator sp. CAR-1]MDO6354200.1 gamma-glutamyl-gamma-aminobutyrate hydrolase family protein [Caloramator sp. CAR-1]
MKKPLIGITADYMISQEGLYTGQERFYIAKDYIDAVLESGGIPVIVPIINKESDLLQIIDQLDGIILSGGHDVNPIYYGEEPSKHVGFTYTPRDLYELFIVKAAIEKDMPILGISRGQQIMVVAFGGKLYQDISQNIGAYINHMQRANINDIGHYINIIPGTRLYKIFDTDRVLVNSFHHQAAKEVPSNFIVSATSSDGVVEAIEHKTKPIMAVQWHPEMMTKKHPIMLRLFEEFINWCK